jgi:hypothetical protein
VRHQSPTMTRWLHTRLHHRPPSPPILPLPSVTAQSDVACPHAGMQFCSAPPLVLAPTVESGTPYCFQALLRARCNPNVLWRWAGCTAIHSAVCCGRWSLLPALLDAGADPSLWATPTGPPAATGAGVVLVARSPSLSLHRVVVSALRDSAVLPSDHTTRFQYFQRHTDGVWDGVLVDLWHRMTRTEGWGKRRAAVIGVLLLPRA